MTFTEKVLFADESKLEIYVKHIAVCKETNRRENDTAVFQTHNQTR